MSDIAAVYILQYLDSFDNIINQHKLLYKYFKTQIIKLKLPLKLFPSFHDEDKIMASCFCLLFDNYDDAVRLRLLENDIFCRKYYHPLKETKKTVEIYNKILCLPCNVDMTKENIDFIINIIK
jgi:dTDP-4-amino-4,6-dideoxygalactose transaminase